MKKNFLIVGILAAFIITLAGCGPKNSSPVAPVQDDSSLIFFYGRECPHCKNVEEFIDKNDVRSKIKFSEREVYHDQANSALLVEKAKQCKIDESNIGVPLLWNNGQCLVGDEDIIKFFEQKLNEKN